MYDFTTKDDHFIDALEFLTELSNRDDHYTYVIKKKHILRWHKPPQPGLNKILVNLTAQPVPESWTRLLPRKPPEKFFELPHGTDWD